MYPEPIPVQNVEWQEYTLLPSTQDGMVIRTPH